MDYDDTSQQLIRLPSGTDDDSHRRCLKLKHCWKFPSHPFHAHLLLLLFRMDFWAPRQVRHREKFAPIRAAFAAICEPKSTTKIENNHNLSGGHGKRETRTLFSYTYRRCLFVLSFLLGCLISSLACLRGMCVSAHCIQFSVQMQQQSTHSTVEWNNNDNIHLYTQFSSVRESHHSNNNSQKRCDSFSSTSVSPTHRPLIYASLRTTIYFYQYRTFNCDSTAAHERTSIVYQMWGRAPPVSRSAADIIASLLGGKAEDTHGDVTNTWALSSTTEMSEHDAERCATLVYVQEWWSFGEICGKDINCTEQIVCLENICSRTECVYDAANTSTHSERLQP